MAKPNTTPIAAPRSKRALLFNLFMTRAFMRFEAIGLEPMYVKILLVNIKILPFHWMSNLHMYIFKF